ncbi:MAG: DUF3048 domain-containing protein [Anaerolineae bacterium]
MTPIHCRHVAGVSAIFTFVAILLFVLAGCGQQPTPEALVEPTMTPKPTFTSAPKPTDTPTPTVAPTVTPTPTPDANVSPLTGLRVSDPSLLERRVLAVRVGNDPNIRPQDGLSLASIVYEEIMDGWSVTRFTALYLDQDAERVRPVRSARLSSLAIAPQYDAALAHSGASDRIRWLISQATDFVDLDEFFNPPPYAFLAGYDWRGRLYTTTEGLHQHLVKVGKENQSRIEGYTFDATPAQGAPATSIHIPYPDSSIADWRWDSVRRRYLRWTAGEPHLDALTGEQLVADNVIIFYAEHRTTDIVEDMNGATAIDIVMAGAGRAQLCRDGVVQDVRWVQPGPSTLIQYYDEDDNLIPLKPGLTWIQLVPPDYAVTLD